MKALAAAAAASLVFAPAAGTGSPTLQQQVKRLNRQVNVLFEETQAQQQLLHELSADLAGLRDRETCVTVVSFDIFEDMGLWNIDLDDEGACGRMGLWGP